MLIIGSMAMKHWFDDFNREPKDLDVIVAGKFNKLELRGHLEAEYGVETVEILKDPGILKYQQEGYLKPELLLTLKCSHIFWDINFDKHMYDIQFLLDKGYEINSKIFNELYEFWNEYHRKNNRSNLEQAAESFFGDNILNLEHSHDFIHTLLKDVPTYTKVLKDGAEVEVCENKFDNLSHQERLDLVIEEVQVMSWERFKNVKWYVGYTRMLKKFLREHAPMWEAMFMIRNWKTLVKCPTNHYKLIDEKLKLV
jgi:hypothetical protein